MTDTGGVTTSLAGVPPGRPYQPPSWEETNSLRGGQGLQEPLNQEPIPRTPTGRHHGGRGAASRGGAGLCVSPGRGQGPRQTQSPTQVNSKTVNSKQGVTHSLNKHRGGDRDQPPPPHTLQGDRRGRRDQRPPWTADRRHAASLAGRAVRRPQKRPMAFTAGRAGTEDGHRRPLPPTLTGSLGAGNLITASAPRARTRPWVAPNWGSAEVGAGAGRPKASPPRLSKTPAPRGRGGHAASRHTAARGHFSSKARAVRG